MIRPSDFRMASNTGVKPSLHMQCPLLASFLHPKQEMQPVYFSNRKRSKYSTVAPAASAPLAASASNVSVFHPLRGPAFTTAIFFPMRSPSCFSHTVALFVGALFDGAHYRRSARTVRTVSCPDRRTIRRSP